jgi:hypothetical protein
MIGIDTRPATAPTRRHAPDVDGTWYAVVRHDAFTYHRRTTVAPATATSPTPHG